MGENMFVPAKGDKADQAVSIEKKSKTTALQILVMETIIFAKATTVIATPPFYHYSFNRLFEEDMCIL